MLAAARGRGTEMTPEITTTQAAVDELSRALEDFTAALLRLQNARDLMLLRLELITEEAMK